ncbi:MAG: hypothetical protein ACKOE2_08390, partial [Actinomycetales bacterium]
GAVLLIGWVAVGVYVMLPFAARHLRACRFLASDARPLPAGLRYGMSCANSCLPLMIVAMATVHQFRMSVGLVSICMVAVTSYIIWAKHPRVTRTQLRASGIAIAAAAALMFTILTPTAGTHHADHFTVNGS